MNGYLQTAEHLIVSRATDDVFRHKLIFQPIVDEVFGVDAAVYQSANLLHHTILQTLLEPTGNLLTPQFSVDVDAYYRGE